MSNVKKLEAKSRERVGKGAARASRNEARVPAVIYGAGKPPAAISLDYLEATKLIYAGRFLTTLFDIKVEGGETVRAIPRDYQLDPVRDHPMHVDFLRLVSGSKVRVEVPVHFINNAESPGLKRGGALNIVRHTVLMQVLADNIPEYLTADLAGLDINHSLHISKIKLPEGARVLTQEKDLTLATIVPPSGMKDEAAEAAAKAAAAAAAPVAGAAPAAGAAGAPAATAGGKAAPAAAAGKAAPAAGAKAPAAGAKAPAAGGKSGDKK